MAVVPRVARAGTPTCAPLVVRPTASQTWPGMYLWRLPVNQACIASSRLTSIPSWRSSQCHVPASRRRADVAAGNAIATPTVYRRLPPARAELQFVARTLAT